MSIIETTPLGTQAGIVDRVLSTPHPRIALPTIASNYNMSLVDLQALLHHHGYPDPARMRNALARLTAAVAAAVADDTRSATTDPEQDLPNVEDTDGRLARVPIGSLHPDPDNVRAELTGIEELADSMRETGLLQPIVARRSGGRLIVVAGHRRLAAAKHLRWTDIPCIVRGDMKPADVIAAMLIENGHRTDLDPIDEARGLARLKEEFGYTDVQLGKRVGRSQVYVSTRLTFLALTPEEQDQVRNGSMRLVEATHRGRMNAGTVGKKGQNKNWHIGPAHKLADRVKARCEAAGHPKGRHLGGMGCGECWETVIRTDERTSLQTYSNTRGACALCDAAVTVGQVPA